MMISRDSTRHSSEARIHRLRHGPLTSDPFAASSALSSAESISPFFARVRLITARIYICIVVVVVVVGFWLSVVCEAHDDG